MKSISQQVLDGRLLQEQIEELHRRADFIHRRYLNERDNMHRLQATYEPEQALHDDTNSLDDDDQALLERGVRDDDPTAR